MKNKIFAAAASCVLLLNLGFFASADVKSRKMKRTAQVNPLVSLLPATDGVVVLDSRRFFDDALPRLLSANQPMLDKLLTKMEEAKTRTGIDFRQFDQLAVGFNTKQIAAKNYDIDPVVIARGQANSGALIASAKSAANGKYREEKLGSRTIYIFAAKEIAAQHKPQDPAKADMADKVIGKMSKDVAAAALDANTLVFGDLALVRKTLDGRTKIGADITNLLGRKPGAVADFAARMPAGMSAFLPLENDELGKNIDSIRYVYGNLDIAGEITALSLTAKTAQPAQAKSLLETLQGLQMVGKAFLGSATSADKQVYARMIENAKFSSTGNEVSLDLQVPQSDVDVLVGGLK